MHRQQSRALHCCQKGCINIGKILFQNGADIHVDCDVVVQVAVASGHKNMTRFLLEIIDLYAILDKALLFVKCQNHEDMVEVLLEKRQRWKHSKFRISYISCIDMPNQNSLGVGSKEIAK